MGLVSNILFVMQTQNEKITIGKNMISTLADSKSKQEKREEKNKPRIKP